MNAIAAVDANWGIGYKGELLANIPADMKYFRAMTTNKTVVMGRKTLESFPNQRPLPNRTNIVLTKNPSYEVKGAVVVHSMDELREELKKYNEEEIFVIGGEMIYGALIDYCQYAYITKIDFSYNADAYFPTLDGRNGWSREIEGEEQTYFDMIFSFDRYKNEKVKSL